MHAQVAGCEVDTSVVTDALKPTADQTAGHESAATTSNPDAPRLPDAVPGETATPAPVEAAPDPSVAEPEIPAAPQKSGTPGTFFVLMLLIVGAIVAIAAIARPWESTPEEPATVVADPAATTPDTTPAATATTAPSTIDPSADESAAAATTTIVVGALPQPAGDDGAGQTEPSPELLATCQQERTTLSDAMATYFRTRTGTPSDPEALIAAGLVEQHPQGWSTRWQIKTSAFGTAVFPVEGTECDLWD